MPSVEKYAPGVPEHDPDTATLATAIPVHVPFNKNLATTMMNHDTEIKNHEPANPEHTTNRKQHTVGVQLDIIERILEGIKCQDEEYITRALEFIQEGD